MAEFQLLGPVEVWAAGRQMDAGQPRQRGVLAALLVDAGRPVSAERLIDRVWGDAAPEAARRALHSHITRIRRMLEQAGAVDGVPVAVARRSGGYVAEVDLDRVDLHRFHRLVDRAVTGADDPAERARLLRAALDLWQGDPLTGVSGEWAERTRSTYVQRRVDATIGWADAMLAVGDAQPVVAPLTDLVAEHPLSEPLAATLMRALYAVGRGTDALEVYRLIRQRLIEDLGVEPGSDLRDLHRAVLRGDPDPAGPRGPAAPVVPAVRAVRPPRPVPALLPLDVYGFTGRTPELARLNEILKLSANQPTAVIIAAISGTAGVGKTALAVHWAHLVRDQFPDGQLYLDLRGFDPDGPAMTPAEAVRRLLDALQVPPHRLPADPRAQIDLYRTELAGRRMLVVLDNARDTAQVRPLLPGSPTALAVVTSRDPMSGLVAGEGAHVVGLDVLSTTEARELLATRLGADRVAAESRAAGEIVDSCAHLPLALAIVVARAATDPAGSLETIAAQLRDTRHSLDLLDTGDPSTDVRAVFSWSYRILGDDAARVFRLLGLASGGDLPAPAIASLAGWPVPRVRAALAELTAARLVFETTTGRYTFHDLLRAYAAELVARIDDDAGRAAAVHRLADHYLHAAAARSALLYPQRDPIVLDPPGPGVTVDGVSDRAEALAWFGVERAGLTATVRLAADNDLGPHTWLLAWAMEGYLDRQGHWLDCAAALELALRAADRAGAAAARARVRRGLARAYVRLGRLAEARRKLDKAVRILHDLGDRVAEGFVQLDLSVLAEHRDDRRGALAHAERALRLFEQTGDLVGQANAHNSVGWCRARLGDLEPARLHCEQALELHRRTGAGYAVAHTWDSLGFIHDQSGAHHRAVDCYDRALDVYREHGDRYNEAATLVRLGEAHAATGDGRAAADAWRRALVILDDLDHPDADRVRTLLTSR